MGFGFVCTKFSLLKSSFELRREPVVSALPLFRTRLCKARLIFVQDQNITVENDVGDPDFHAADLLPRVYRHP